MNILITGYKGFVGTTFVTRLKDHNLTLIDIKDNNDCRDFFKTSNKTFDLVIHLAAIVGGRQTIDGNPLSVAIDLSIDSEMFNWALRTRPKKIVYFSSSAAYPVRLQKNKYLLKESDINLNDISSPDMTYGWAKLTGEYLCKFAREKGLNVYAFRPFSGYGATQDLDYPFPSYIRRAVSKLNPFEIWGDGNQVRDFIHIEDIVDCVLTVINHKDGQSYMIENGALNLCSGKATNFNELCDLICSQIPYQPKKIHKLDNPIGVNYRVGDPTNMLNFYQPKLNLLDGIKQSINYFSNIN